MGPEIISHCGSQTNLHFQFAIVIRQNKCNHLLLFMLFHVILFKKIIATVTCSLKIDI